MTAPRLPRLVVGDPLRGVAALGVLLYHVSVFPIARLEPGNSREEVYGGFAGNVFEAGSYGVYLFFVLSGYLIARPFIAAFLTGAQRPRLARYTRHRVLRIVPLLWFVWLVTLLRFGSAGSTTAQVLLVPAFGQVYDPSRFSTHIGQAWTLDSELFFYALVPLAGWIAWRSRSRLSERARAGLALGVPLVVFVLVLAARWAAEVTPLESQQVQFMLHAFMPGVALAALDVLRPAPLERLVAGAGAVRLIGGLGIALVVAGVVVDGSPYDPLNVALPVLGTGTLVAAVLCRQWSGRAAWRALDNRPLHWLGERSYSIYLVHVFVLLQLEGLVKTLPGPRTGLLVIGVIAIPLTLLVATLTYRFVERPFLRMRDRAPRLRAEGERDDHRREHDDDRERGPGLGDAAPLARSG